MSGRASFIPELEDDRYEEYEEADNFLRKSNGWKEEKNRLSRKFQDGGDRRSYFREKLSRKSKGRFLKGER